MLLDEFDSPMLAHWPEGASLRRDRRRPRAAVASAPAVAAVVAHKAASARSAKERLFMRAAILRPSTGPRRIAARMKRRSFALLALAALCATTAATAGASASPPPARE